MTEIKAVRGEIWDISFDPSVGDEIQKVRPAVVMTAQGAGRMRLHIVVPITGWRSSFDRYFWMVYIAPSPENGLSKESAADAFQVKSVSVNRFEQRLGILKSDEIEEIAEAVAWCVGFRP